MELLAQVFAERLDNREDDFARGGLNRIALNIVKAAIDIGLVVGIQTVKVHHLQQGLAVDVTNGDIGHFATRGVAQIFDVEFEIVLLDLVGAQGVDILHGEVPHGKIG